MTTEEINGLIGHLEIAYDQLLPETETYLVNVRENIHITILALDAKIEEQKPKEKSWN